MRYLFMLLAVLVANCSYAQDFDVEFRAAYFLPQDNHFRKVYQDGWADYQIEATYHSLDLCCIEFDPWINFSYYQAKGKSTCLDYRSRVRSGSLTVGAKKTLCLDGLDNLSPYLGLGVGADYKTFNDRSPYLHGHLVKWCPTVIAKSGVLVNIPCSCLFLDFFLDYSWTYVCGKHCKDGIRERSFNAGGLFAGAGIGYRF